MPYSQREEENLETVRDALAKGSNDFTKFFDEIFTDATEWTIAGHGPVAGTYRGLSELWETAEAALYERLAAPLTITPRGIWADGADVIVRIESKSAAIDGKPYANEYLYILTMEDRRVVSGIEWLDLDAYYDIVERIAL